MTRRSIRLVALLIPIVLLSAAPLMIAPDGVIEIDFTSLTYDQLVAYMRSTSPYHRTEAGKALGQRGDEAVPLLRDLLSDESSATRRSAADAFVILKEGSRPAVDQLIDAALHDPDMWVRAGAAEAIGQSGIKSTSIDEALARASGDDHTWVREAAMRGLSERSSRKIVEDRELLLSAALASARGDDINYNVWRYAVPIIKQNGGAEDPDVIPVMTHLLSLAPHGMFGIPVIRDAAGMLAAHGAESREAVDVLITAAEKFGVPVLRNSLVEALAAIGPEAVPALLRLEKLRETDEREEVRVVIDAAIPRIRGDDQ